MDAKSAILTFHSLDNSGSVISYPPARFAEEMERLAASRIPVVGLTEVRNLPGSIALTFDDGFANFATSAWPVLKCFRFPATLFVVSGAIGRTNNWNKPAANVPELPLLDATAISELANDGVTIGAHSHTHPDLISLPLPGVEEEMDSCATAIFEMTGQAPSTFAYPYGRSSPSVRQAAASRFACSVGTRLDYCAPSAANNDLPRIDSFYLQGKIGIADLFKPSARAWIAVRAAARAARAALT